MPLGAWKIGATPLGGVLAGDGTNIIGTLAVTDAPDVVTASADLPYLATGSLTDTDDTLVAVGNVTDVVTPILGGGRAADDPDVLTATVLGGPYPVYAFLTAELGAQYQFAPQPARLFDQ